MGNLLDVPLESYNQLALIAGGTGALLMLTKMARGLLQYKRRRDMYKAFEGSPPHWLYGNVNDVTFDEAFQSRLIDYSIRYGDVSCIYLYWIPYLYLNRPDSLGALFRTGEPKEEISYGFVKSWIGDGLLNSVGPKWFRSRRLLTPIFHFETLKPYIKIFNDCANIFIDKIREMSGEGEPSVDVFNHVSLLTLDSLLKCIFSAKTDCQQTGGTHPYIQAVKDISKLIIVRLRTFHQYNDFIYFNLTKSGRDFKKARNITNTFTSDVLQERKQQRHQQGDAYIQGRTHLDFLDMLLEARDEDGAGLTDAEILDEINTFMFEGHDTTASGITWILYNLAKHPEHQEKCRQEVLQVLGDKQEVEWEDMHQLEYLTMSIKESLRVLPPVPLTGRTLTKDFTFPDGRTAPAGTNVWLNIYGSHHNPEVWDNPEEYDPLRFSPDNSKDRHPHAFLPFAAGPRNCIGQNFAMNELRTIVALVLKNFRWSLDSTKPVERTNEMIMRPKDGLWMHFQPISH